MRERRGQQEEAGRATRGLRRVTVYITENYPRENRSPY